LYDSRFVFGDSRIVASTIYVDTTEPVVGASWLNDVDETVYSVINIKHEDYGAVGDGITDDTVAIQAALDSGGKLVRAKAGDTYLVSFTASKTILGTAHRYCLEIPSGVTFDLNGATLKLADSEDAVILINENAGTSQDNDIAIINGFIDGNESNQTTPAAGEMGCIFLHDVLRPRVENIVVTDARNFFGRFLTCDTGHFHNLIGKSCDGDGWSFGLSSNSQHVIQSSIDDIYAEDCKGTYGSSAGNGAIFTIQGCNIGKVETKDCAGGIKIQDDSLDCSIGSLIFKGGTNDSANSGIKLQGGTGNKDLKRINVANVVSDTCHSEGLRITECMDCSVGTYVGEGNGTSGQRDVFIDDCERVTVGHITSSNCGSTAGPAVWINVDAENYKIGTILVYNTGQRAVQVSSQYYGTIDSVDAHDDQGTPTLTEAFAVTHASARGYCGSVRSSRAVATTPIIPAKFTAINLNYEIGRVESGSTNNLGGMVTLDNAATSTTVASNHIYKQYVATSGTDHYFHPIISIVPWNASAMALEASGGFRTTVVRDITGTGFDIKHASSGATDKVVWQVIAWKVLTEQGV
jgi:hypothetical protein